MSDTNISMEVVRQFLAALADGDTAAFDFVLRNDAFMQIERGGQPELYWTRPRVRNALLVEGAEWTNPVLHIRSWSASKESITVNFEVETVEDDLPAYHDCAATFTLRDGQVEWITLHRDESVDSKAPIWFVPLPLPVALMRGEG